MGDSAVASAPRIIGRYAIYDDIASGGMATVHLGRLIGPVGFSRTVAIKRLHPQFAKDPEFVSMFLDEARLAARIQHPNVVPTLDVVATGGELFLVMEYVRGESLGQLVRCAAERGERVPPRIAAAMISGALQGLHAAHESKDEGGAMLGLVHRDVSPQNVLVGVDGTARVLDFGVAKAENKVHATRDGQLKGKLLYMSPEQLEDNDIDRRTDIYAMGLVLFEVLCGERMFSGAKDGKAIAKIMRNEVRFPSSVVPALEPFDPIVRKATVLATSERFATAREMALAVERVGGVASPAEVADWVEAYAGERINARTRRVAEIESAAQLERTEVQSQLAYELARTADDPEIPAGRVNERALREGSQSGVAQRRPSMTDTTAGSGMTRAPYVEASNKPKWLIPMLAGCGAITLIALIVIAFFAGKRSDTPQTNSAASMSPPALTSTPSVVLAAPPSTTQQEAPSATASATVSPGVNAKAKPVAVFAGPVKNCDPAYTLDAKGHRHFKPECL